MASNHAGDIEQTIKDSGGGIEISSDATDREGVARGLSAAILSVLPDTHTPDEASVTAEIHVRKATKDKPRRVIVHAEHTSKRRRSILVLFSK